MTLDIEEVVELLRQAQAERTKDKSEPRDATAEWIEAKNIDIDSLTSVLDRLTGQTLERVIGRLSLTNTPSDAREILRDMLGAGFELGYTAAELQLEQKFLADDDE